MRPFTSSLIAIAALTLLACGGAETPPTDAGMDAQAAADAQPGGDTGSSSCEPACGAGEECCGSCTGGAGTCRPTGACGPCPGPACGATVCAIGEVCCTDCDGVMSCAEACAGPPCPGEDAGSPSPDAGADDDAGPAPCPNDTCRLDPGGACEAPSGPTGNGCCECTDGVCTNRCRCLAADTPIATPRGDVPVSALAVGDLVYSVHEDQVVAVPIARVHATPVQDHVVVRVRLASGATLHVSPRHPTADGRDFGQLATGDELDGVGVLEATVVPYDGAFTHDLLPASDTGTYFAAGARIGSTLSAQ